MFCSKCGTEISKDATFCSACGAAQKETKSSSAPNTAEPQKESYSAMSIVGLIFSILSITPLPYMVQFDVALTFPFVGLILSALGYSECGKKNKKGKPVAITGIAIGIISCVGVVYLLLK